MTSALVLPLLALLAAPGDEAADWIGRQAGGVELALAHDHGRGRLDGGVLTVDPNRRVVLWAGIEGDLGCPTRIEVPFADVRSVQVEAVGFTLVLRRGPLRRLVLMPRPHARWLRASQTNNAEAMRVLGEMPGSEEGIPMGGPTTFAGPVRQRVDLPAEVERDVRRAVDAIRDALGRTPTPSAALLEALHSAPRDLELDELLASGPEREEHAVRTSGILRARPDGGYELASGEHALRVVPTAAVAKLWEVQARAWAGQEVELVGVPTRGERDESGTPPLVLSVWEFSSGPVPEAPPEGRLTTLAALAQAPPAEGEIVRVVGRFRGQNLFSDLPGPAPGGQAWVIQSGEAAAWVTGRAPAGKGWALSLESADDTAYWVEVVGRASVDHGQVRIRARRVALSLPPAEEQAPVQRRLAAGRSGVPPVVVFALPVEGTDPVPPDTRFVLQFSKYMDASSFAGRVRLSYVPEDGDGSATGPFANVRTAYDDTRRALVVDPGETLAPGRLLQCVLLPGIVDLDGLPLVPGGTGGGSEQGYVLRYRVAR